MLDIEVQNSVMKPLQSCSMPVVRQVKFRSLSAKHGVAPSKRTRLLKSYGKRNIEF